MNNFTFGDDTHGYYETIAGGAGAGPSWNGRSGVHTHMTNTRITDPEIFERRYPIILRKFQLRHGSGGNGQFKGGDGVVREIEFRKPQTVSILSERRVIPPKGIFGGQDGKCGENLVKFKSSGRIVSLGGKNTINLDVGDRIVIKTPGGGGFGIEKGQPTHEETRYELKSKEEVHFIGVKTVESGSVANYKRLQENA